MTTRPLPTFLTDLTFALDGQTYQLFPVPNKDNHFIFGLEDDGYYNYGVIVNLEEETVEIKDSHSIKRYRDGYSKFHTHWHGCEPDWEEAGPFEVWLREHVKKDIERHLAWHLERRFRKYNVGSNLDVYEAICNDFARLPNFEFTHYRNRSLKFNVLSAIHRSRSSGNIDLNDRHIFDQFVEELETGDLFERDEAQFLSLFFNLLPTIPDIITAYHDNALIDMYDVSNYKDDNPLQCATNWIRNLKNKSPTERSEHHKHLLPTCTSPALCHAIAAGLFEWPKEAELYIEKGLRMKPDNISLLMIAETFYLNHPKGNTLDTIRQRINKMDVKPSSDNIQQTIDRYIQLCNDYQYFRPSTNTMQTAPELLALETKLNTHWLEILPDRSSLSRSYVEQQLIEQQRFVSSGSASICAWMRNQKRYQEVVDHMIPLCNQQELCVLRHKSNHRGFEAFINNGLSCFLDSQNDTHISQAMNLLNMLEACIPTWESNLVPYTFACITARAGEIDRCFKYIQLALSKGDTIHSMAHDSDFANVHNHPRFLALLEAA